MANPDKATVIRDVKSSSYATLFEQVWGPGSLDNIDAAYDQLALSIAAFERTRRFGEFSSKYDAYLEACLGLGGEPDACAQGMDVNSEQAGEIFTTKEWHGLQLFMGFNNNDGILEENEGAMCSYCHIAVWSAALPNATAPEWAPAGFVPPLFASFTYDNLGIPKSGHRLLEDNEVDLGLGPTVAECEENGKFRVMSLRNIKMTKPYGHNGYFMKLSDMTHFINTRDLSGEDWAAPEYPDTVNTDETGNMGLGAKDEAALVKFMKTLTDGYRSE